MDPQNEQVKITPTQRQQTLSLIRDWVERQVRRDMESHPEHYTQKQLKAARIEIQQ